MDSKLVNSPCLEGRMPPPKLEALKNNAYYLILITSSFELEANQIDEMRLQKGDIVLCQESFTRKIFQHGEIKNNRPFIVKPVSFDEVDDAHYLQSLGPVVVISPAIRANRPVINDILALIDDHYIKSTQILPSVLDRLLTILQSEAAAAFRMSDVPQNFIAALDDQKIAQSLSLIHQDIHENWSAADLAASVKMPASQFLARFTELLLIDPETYILRWRLQKSITLLAGTRLSIFDIAEESGFSSEDKFRHVFCDSFGVSPSEYRQKTNH